MIMYTIDIPGNHLFGNTRKMNTVSKNTAILNSRKSFGNTRKGQDPHTCSDHEYTNTHEHLSVHTRYRQPII